MSKHLFDSVLQTHLIQLSQNNDFASFLQRGSQALQSSVSIHKEITVKCYLLCPYNADICI